MRRLWLAIFVALPICGLRADSLADALQARALVGPEHWSRLIEIENSASDPRHPLSFHALLFALEDRLWLYDNHEGTQSLSLFAGRLAADEADPAPLLKRVLPHFRSFRDITDDVTRTGAPAVARGGIPYGCFIECVARWRALRAAGSTAEFAGILAVYFDTGAGPCGHSVLLYTENGRRRVFDPEEGLTMPMPSGADSNTPLQIARAIFISANPFRALLLALHPPEVAVASLAVKKSPRSS